jgi:hypothetical protein
MYIHGMVYFRNGIVRIDGARTDITITAQIGAQICIVTGKKK